MEKEKSSEDSKQEWDECLILIPFLLLLLIMLHIFFNIFFVYLSLSSCFSPYPFFLIPFLMRFFFLAPFYSLPSFTPFFSCLKVIPPSSLPTFLQLLIHGFQPCPTFYSFFSFPCPLCTPCPPSDPYSLRSPTSPQLLHHLTSHAFAS